jgi:hypothetical protein
MGERQVFSPYQLSRPSHSTFLAEVPSYSWLALKRYWQGPRNIKSARSCSSLVHLQPQVPYQIDDDFRLLVRLLPPWLLKGYEAACVCHRGKSIGVCFSHSDWNRSMASLNYFLSR